MSSPSWSPPETSDQIYVEKTFLRGAILCGIAYGAEAMLFTVTFWSLWRQLSRSSRRRTIYLLVYISLINLFGTFWVASNSEFTLLAFIDNRNYPGGPAQYEADFFYIPIDALGNVSFTFITVLADGLLLWRFYIIYKTCRYPLTLVVGPAILLYLGSCTTGILLAVQYSSSSPWTSSSVNWTIPFFSISISYNIIITLAIVGRLLLFRRRLQSSLSGEHINRYASIAAMLVESSALASLYMFIFLITFAIDSPLSNVFLQALGPVLIIATLLIVFRVAQGSAWSGDTSTTLFSTQSGRDQSTRLRFRTQTTTGDHATSTKATDFNEPNIDIHVHTDAISDSRETFAQDHKKHDGSLQLQSYTPNV